MAINKKLIHFKKKETFDRELSAGNILDTSIVFIQDAKMIWTHGTLYPCPFTIEELKEFVKNNTIYQTDLPDDLVMPNTVGGIKANTKVSDLEGDSFSQMFDNLLFPEIQPTIQNPSSGISFKNSFSSGGIYEVGATSPTVENLNGTFNRGTCTVVGQSNKYRAGGLDNENSWFYYGGTVTNKTFPEKITLGTMSYYYHASYSEGDVLVTSKGNKANVSPNPLTAGSVNSGALSIYGTYPYYCNGASGSTSSQETSFPTSVSPNTKLPLKKWTDTLIGVKFASEATTGTRLYFEYPSSKTISKVEFFNTVSGKWEVFGTDKYIVSSSGNKTIQGNQIAYSKLTTQGALSGALQLRFTVSNTVKTLSDEPYTYEGEEITDEVINYIKKNSDINPFEAIDKVNYDISLLASDTDRATGVASFAVNFEPGGQSPLDARTLVPTKSSLINTESYKNKNYYKGMMVIVEDTQEIYILKDISKISSTDYSGWKRVDVGAQTVTEIINNLTSTSTSAALSANMGKHLQDTKLNKSDVINNLTTTDSSKALSASQGKVLNDKILAIGNAYRVKGSKTNLSEVLSITNAKVGDVWNITTEFTLHGKPFPASTNLVCITDTSESDHDEDNWDPLGGTVDLTPYATKSEVSNTYATKEEVEENEKVTAESLVDLNSKLEDNETKIDTHISNKSNPHSVTKAQIGLGNVDNTSDANKPISNATKTELDKKIQTVSITGSGNAITNATISGTTLTLSKEATYNNYTLPKSTTTALGGIMIGYAENGKNYPIELDSSGKAFVNIPWTDTKTTYSVVTQSANGLMSSTDKKKLDGIETGAQVNKVNSVAGKTGDVTLSKNDVGLGNVTNESKATMFTNAALTGTPTAPTAGSGTNSTQIATTAFVQTEINNKIAASDAMIYKGTIGSTGATITSLPASHKTGWTYKVITAGTYAGQKCEIGDMIICLTDGSTATDSHWTVVQANIDGVVTGPSSAVDKRVAIFNGTTGKLIADSGFTIGKSVPSNAVFTDTTYNVATSSSNGLMSSSDKAKLDGITASADPNQNAFSNITIGSTTISADNPTDTLTIVAGSNITLTPDNTNDKITIAAKDTTYGAASSSTLGLVKTGSNITNSSGTISITKENVTSALGYTPPTTDTNTHYTTHLYAGTGSAANASTTNGNTKLTVTDDSTVRSTITLKGSGGTSVTSDASGNVTVNSPSVTLGTLGITATAAELNYCDGVTSNIQTQLNGKSATNHNHNSSYVSALGTSGNYVTWTKNGTTNNITVPYSSNSDKLEGLKRWYSINFNNKPCLRIITLTVLATYINIPITFDIQGRSSNAKSSISISFNSENNTDPTIQNVYYIGDAKYGRNIRVYKSGTGIWEVWLKQQEEGYDSVVISNISYKSSNIKFEITESSADALPSYSTYKDSSLFVLDNNISGTAANANKTTNSLVLKFNSGTSEGNNLYTFNGSSGKTIDIKSGSNVSLSTSGNTVTISSTNTTYGLASTSSNGLLRQLNGNTSQFMRGDGNWGTPINTTYSQATSSTLGLVKIGFPESGQNYPVELNSSGQMFVNVPWTDTKLTVDSALSSTSTNPVQNKVINSALSGKANSSHTHSTSQISGLATVATSGSYNDLSNKPTIPSAYTLPKASSTALGGIMIGYAESGKNYPVELDSSGKAFVNVPWTDTNTVPQFQIYAGTTDITNNTNAAGFSGTPKLKLNTDSNEQHAILFQGGAGVNVTIGGDGTNKYIQAGINSSTFKSSIVPTIFTGAISGLIDTNLTSSRALISNTSGKISASSVTSTQLGYLNGVTSSIQTQLNTIKANCIYRGVCFTSAGTAAKTVSVDGDFTLTAGVFVAIRFEQMNAASNPTLNVNNTGAKAIFYRGAAWKTSQDPARQYDTILMTYDGTQWMISALLEPNKVNFSNASSTLRAKNFNLDTSTSSNGTITRTSGIQDLYFDSDILSTTSGLFPHSSNANACITVKTNSGNYYHQIGLSSNKKMYARSFQNVVPNSTTSWYTIPYCEDSQDWTGYQDFQSGAGNTGSDMRFKEKKNEEIDNILPDLMNLKVFEYIWRKEGEREKDTFGVSANQLLEFGGVFEKIVHEREDKEKTKWVEYDRIGVLTLKGLQETNKKLEEKCKKYESALKILGEKLGIDLNDLLDNNED